MPELSGDDRRHLSHALDLATRGLGAAEPNPMVGCVLVKAGQMIGEGWHRRFGGPHAEVEALAAAKAAGHDPRGATAVVTLEPCCHTGKTPPCTDALVAAGVARVVVGAVDPNPQVAGGGVAALESAGVEVALADGDEARQATELIVPFAKLMTRGRPWIIAKWAMTLDGKLAAATGDSKWISGEMSRSIVHRLRARVDAVMVGRRTAEVDDPLLTARGPVGDSENRRIATRIVVDSQAGLAPGSQLVRSAFEAPVLVAASTAAPAANVDRLRSAGVEVWLSPSESHADRLADLLDELGRRRMTNVLVEGGAQLFGALLGLREIDEVHAFIAPKLLGGAGPSPIAGRGAKGMLDAVKLVGLRLESLGGDAYLSGSVG